jgi:hypothetical protein
VHCIRRAISDVCHRLACETVTTVSNSRRQHTHTRIAGICKMHQTDRQRNALLQCDGSTHRRCCTDADTCQAIQTSLHCTFLLHAFLIKHTHTVLISECMQSRVHMASQLPTDTCRLLNSRTTPHISTPASTWAGSGHAHVMHTPQPLNCVVHLLLQAVSTNDNVMCPCTITDSMMLPTAVGEGTPCI